MPTSACPPSWYAVRRRSSTLIITLRSAPRMIRSSASVKSASSTCSWPRRAARSAASLTRFARSAPTIPGVLDAMRPRSTSGPIGTPRVCTRRIASRPVRSGGCTATRRSNRPGRRSAWSSTSGRLVAAITITLVAESKPSISVRIWFSVCSRSSLPPLNPATPEVRERPIASSSSMNTIAGAAAFACAKRSRTRAAPMPTIASTNSEADSEKNGTFASPATARASSVFPVPGGPESSTPCGMRAPSRWYFSGWRRKSTTSESSSFASSIPATSAKVTRPPARLVALGARAAEACRAPPARCPRGASAGRAAR